MDTEHDIDACVVVTDPGGEQHVATVLAVARGRALVRGAQDTRTYYVRRADGLRAWYPEERVRACRDGASEFEVVIPPA